MRATPYSNEELDKLARGEPDQFGNDDHAVVRMLAQEILEHREWLAYFGRVVEAQTLDVKAIGKGRRKILKDLVLDLRDQALRGPRTMGRNHRSVERESQVLLREGHAYVDDWSSGEKVTEYLETSQ